MSEPEIARRCSTCGVSVRSTAMYCPQCGEKMGDNEIRVADVPLRVSDDPIRENPAPVSSAPHPHGLTGVADNVRERVEKIRHVSSVMIDQAAYDPSLRFLLVAAVLFILFLILLIISKLIG